MPVESSISQSDPSLLRGLTEQQQVRLTEILDGYLNELEQGRVPDRQDLLSDYPELAEALQLYLDKLEQLYQLADGSDRPLGSDLSGKQLGEYLLETEIGRGGMGIVFSAYQASLDRHVAVKLLPMAAVLDPKSIERFKNEARAAAQLQHPNIVPVYSVGELKGIHFYAMRLIEGDSLDQRIAKYNAEQTDPPTHSALRQFADVAMALQVAHEFGIVHRDIKPSNLLLDGNGKLWLADFGLARVQKDSGLTAVGDMPGTMRYMSPEQAQGRNEMVDHRSDIYSLGATLYELLTGMQLIQGEDGPGLLPKISARPPIRLKSIRPDLPSELQTVLEKALAKHRDDRYTSALEFGNDLRRVVNGEPIGAKLVSPVVLVGRWMAAHSRLVSFLVAACCILAFIVGTTIYQFNGQLKHQYQEAQQNLDRVRQLEQGRGEIIDRLALVPGAQDVRRDLIASQIEFYESLATRDANLEADLAEAYSRNGSLQEERGDIEASIAAYRQAEDLLAKQGKPSPELIVLRAQNRNRLAVVLLQSGEWADSRSLLEKQTEQLLPLLRDNSTDHRLNFELALAQNTLGLLEGKNGAFDRAEIAFENSLKRFESLVLDHPSDTLILRGYAHTLHNFGQLLAASEMKDRWEEAREMMELATEQHLRIGKAMSNPIRVAPELADTYISLGKLSLNAGEAHNAIASFENAVQLTDRLTKISPESAAYQQSLAAALSNLGVAQLEDRQFQSAQVSLSQSADKFRQLHGTFPNHEGLKQRLSTVLRSLSAVVARLGDDQNSRQLLQEANSLTNSAP